MPRRITVATWSVVILLALMNVYLVSQRTSSGSPPAATCAPCNTVLISNDKPHNQPRFPSPPQQRKPEEPEKPQSTQRASSKQQEEQENKPPEKYVPPPPGINTSNKTCSLLLIATANDAWRLRRFVPHLVRGSQFPFEKKKLYIDTTADGKPPFKEGSGLHATLEALLAAGWIDEYRGVEASRERIEEWYKRTWDDTVNVSAVPTHVKADKYRRGLLSYIQAMEECTSDYCLHYDIDIGLYSKKGYSWVNHGIEVLEKHEDILVVAPASGPPRPDGQYWPKSSKWDIRGFYLFDYISTRHFLISKKKYEAMKPLKAWMKGEVHFEQYVYWTMREKKQWRADLPSGQAGELLQWAGHMGYLSNIVSDHVLGCIEAGRHPPGGMDGDNLRDFAWTNCASYGPKGKK